MASVAPQSELKLAVDNRLTHEEISLKAKRIFDKLSADGKSKYLRKKQVGGYDIRYGNGYIAIPMIDADNKLWNLQFISDKGNKGFLTGGMKSGSLFLIGDLQDENEIFVAEDYATAASIYKATLKPIVVAFNAGNLESVVRGIKKRLSHMQIVIAADDDCWQEKNVSREKAKAIAKKYKCVVTFPVFKDTSSKPTNFNDLHCLEGLDAVRKHMHYVLHPSNLPPNFHLYSDGLYWYDEESPPVKLCSAIEVTAFSHDENDANHGLVLEWTSQRTKQKHKWIMPMRLLSGDGTEIYTKLLDEGLLLSPEQRAKKKFLEFLATIEAINH